MSSFVVVLSVSSLARSNAAAHSVTHCLRKAAARLAPAFASRKPGAQHAGERVHSLERRAVDDRRIQVQARQDLLDYGHSRIDDVAAVRSRVNMHQMAASRSGALLATTMAS